MSTPLPPPDALPGSLCVHHTDGWGGGYVWRDGVRLAESRNHHVFGSVEEAIADARRAGRTEPHGATLRLHTPTPKPEGAEAVPGVEAGGVHPLALAVLDAQEAYTRLCESFDTLVGSAYVAARDIEDRTHDACVTAIDAWSAAGFPRAKGGGR